MQNNTIASQRVGNKLLDALLAGKPEKIETLLAEDCEVHIPFPKKKKIKLKGKKQTMDYFINNFTTPISEKAAARNAITGGDNRAMVYTKAWSSEKRMGSLTDYCSYFKVEDEKIIELFLLVKTYE